MQSYLAKLVEIVDNLPFLQRLDWHNDFLGNPLRAHSLESLNRLPVPNVICQSPKHGDGCLGQGRGRFFGLEYDGLAIAAYALHSLRRLFPRKAE